MGEARREAIGRRIADRIAALETETLRLRQALAAAEEALRPFAKFADEFEGSFTMPVPDNVWPSMTLPMSAFRVARRARQAVSNSTEERTTEPNYAQQEKVP